MSVHAVVQVYAWLDWFVFDQETFTDKSHRYVTSHSLCADHSGNDIKYPCNILGIALMDIHVPYRVEFSRTGPPNAADQFSM